MTGHVDRRHAGGGRERRVRSDSGRGADFRILSPENLRRLTRGVAAAIDVVRHGLRVLVDKEEFAAALPRISGDKPPESVRGCLDP